MAKKVSQEFQEQYDILVSHTDGIYNPLDVNDIRSLTYTVGRMPALLTYAKMSKKEDAFREICDAAALCYGQSVKAMPAQAFGHSPEEYPGAICKKDSDFVSRVSDDFQHGSVNVYLSILQSVPSCLNLGKSFNDLHAGSVVYYIPDNIATDDLPKMCEIDHVVFGTDDNGFETVEQIGGYEDGNTEERVSFSKEDFGKNVFTSANMCRAALNYEREVFHQGLKEWEHETGQDTYSNEDFKQMELEQANGFGVDFSKPVGEFAPQTREPVKMTEEQKAQTQQVLNSKWSMKRELPTIDGDISDSLDKELE